MPKALADKLIIEMDKADFVQDAQTGFFMPSKALSREFMKRAGALRTIDENFTNHIRTGIVVSRGPLVGWHDDVPQLEDMVAFNRHNGEEWDYKDKHYITIDWKQILCIYRFPGT